MGIFVIIGITFFLIGCSENQQGFTPQQMTDNLYTVLSADRKVYARDIVTRLVNKEKVITASEEWKEEKALVLPAQMFRRASEEVRKKDPGFSFELKSHFPVNKKNIASTDLEKEGLKYVADNIGENFYGEETLGGDKYFTAIYPDVAVAEACVTCHNNHDHTSKTDWKLGDVMGGVIIRVKY